MQYYRKTQIQLEGMPFLELCLEEKMFDSVSSLGSVSSLEDEEEEEEEEVWPAKVGVSSHRRAPSVDNIPAPSTPLQGKRIACGRPHSVGYNTHNRNRRQIGGSFQIKRTPKLEASVREDGIATAITSLRMLVSNERRRPFPRSTFQDDSNSKTKVNYNRDAGSSSPRSRYSRRRFLDRSPRDARTCIEELTTNGSSCNKSMMDMEGSSRWAAESITENVLRLPARQMTNENLLQEAVDERRLSRGSEKAARCA